LIIYYCLCLSVPVPENKRLFILLLFRKRFEFNLFKFTGHDFGHIFSIIKNIDQNTWFFIKIKTRFSITADPDMPGDTKLNF